MTRKILMVAAVALVALTSSLSVGKAEAHWYHGGYWGGGWGGYHGYWNGYGYGYGYGQPYYAPNCYRDYYGRLVCY